MNSPPQIRVEQIDAAIEQVRRLLAAEPQRADGWSDLAKLLQLRGRAGEAVECLRQIAQMRPDDAALTARLANALLEARDPAAAEVEARRAIALDAKLIAGWINLGVALHHQGRLDEAAAAYSAAIALKPDAALAHSNLSDALVHLGRLHEAEQAAHRAVEIDPSRQGYWMNWTSALMRIDQPEQALDAAQRAIQLKPSDHRAHANAGMALLTLGRWSEGFPEFEQRIAEFSTKPRTRAVWDGSPLNGRAILLRGEQGFGDTIQFVRYAPVLRERCGAGTIVLECRAPLAALMKTAHGVDEVIDASDPTPPGVDVEVFVMSLPHRLGTTVETVPADVPYLHVDPRRVEAMRSHVRESAKQRIGVVWAGNPQQTDDRRRSCPIEELRPLANVDGVELYSLQKGPAAERDARAAAEMGMSDLAATCDDFADLAAAMSLMDLVISVCTAPAHLAGALGLKVWTMLPRVCDWRWLRGRSDSPWYPTMRLFRQPDHGDWAGVVHAIAAELNRVNLPR